MAERTTIKFEQQYPNLWAWIQGGGCVRLGNDEDGIFALVYDEGGTVWDSEDETFDDPETLFAELEQQIDAYCGDNGIELEMKPTKPKKRQSGGNYDKLIEIESSMISAVKYISKDKILEATFNSGQVWHYLDVPKNVFNKLLEADSKGSFMRNQIIGEYDEIQVSNKRKK